MNNLEKVKALRDGTAGNRRTYWTPEAINTLTNMFYEQVGITEMAVYFDRSERAIMNQLDKLGLYRRVRAANKPKEGCLCSACTMYSRCKEQGPLCEQ